MSMLISIFDNLQMSVLQCFHDCSQTIFVFGIYIGSITHKSFNYFNFAILSCPNYRCGSYVQSYISQVLKRIKWILYPFGFRQIGHQDSSSEKFCSFAKVLSYLLGLFIYLMFSWAKHIQNSSKCTFLGQNKGQENFKSNFSWDQEIFLLKFSYL